MMSSPCSQGHPECQPGQPRDESLAIVAAPPAARAHIAQQMRVDIAQRLNAAQAGGSGTRHAMGMVPRHGGCTSSWGLYLVMGAGPRHGGCTSSWGPYLVLQPVPHCLPLPGGLLVLHFGCAQLLLGIVLHAHQLLRHRRSYILFHAHQLLRPPMLVMDSCTLAYPRVPSCSLMYQPLALPSSGFAVITFTLPREESKASL